MLFRSEVLRRATEPFFTTKEDGRGTGLGLSTVYGFARQSGGFLDIASIIGNGTSISIYFPRVAEGVTNEKQSAARQIPKGDGELILVVEDQDAVREVTMSRLEGLGYSAIEANSPSAAIEILQTENQISLVLSDIVMPGRLSGFDLARWIQANKPNVPIILASGNISPERFEAEKLERVTLLAKPYSREDLARAVKNVLL